MGIPEPNTVIQIYNHKQWLTGDYNTPKDDGKRIKTLEIPYRNIYGFFGFSKFKHFYWRH